MRLSPQELLGYDDQSIGSLIRQKLMDEDGIDINEISDKLSEEEIQEIFETRTLGKGVVAYKCPASGCGNVIMKAEGAAAPTKCTACGEGMTGVKPMKSNTEDSEESGVTQHFVFNVGQQGNDKAVNFSDSENVSNTDHETNDEETIDVRQFGKTVTLSDMPIFATGTHNKVAYLRKHLDQMVTNFRLLKGKVIPPLKLGHTGQKLEAQGRPAAGWMEDLYRKGDVLYAKFKQVPEQIAKLIKDGAWKRPSAEIYKNYKDSSGKEYGFAVAACALLGNDLPAVKDIAAWDSLPQITKLYDTSLDGNDIQVIELHFENDEGLVIIKNDEGGSEEMSAGTGIEERLKALEDQNGEAANAYEDRIKQLEDEVASAKAAAVKARITAFTEQMKKKGKLTPAVEENVIKLFEAIEDSEPLKFTEENEEGEEVETEQSLSDLFREILEGLPATVDYSEHSTGEEGRSGETVVVSVGNEKIETDPKKNEVVTEADMDGKIRKYCEEHDMDPDDAEQYGEVYILLAEE